MKWWEEEHPEPEWQGEVRISPAGLLVGVMGLTAIVLWLCVWLGE